MRGLPFYPHQLKALDEMKNGCILCGGTGSGKSMTALAYYYRCQGGNCTTSLTRMVHPKDLYIITTARKRDTLDWEEEMLPFMMKRYRNHIVVDSWNNIKKYRDVKGAFFIFDEQRVVGSGVWVKSFLRIAKHNDWILLSATPGDVWTDYIPVFIANGFYRNKSEFLARHAVFKRFSKFPQIEKFLDEDILERYRSQILVDMKFDRLTTQIHEDIFCTYSRKTYKEVIRKRWDVFKDEPIINASSLCYILRKIVNSDESRVESVLKILKDHPKAIIFYNYDYELEILKSVKWPKGTKNAEWNGHAHEPIPNGDNWVYFVQYSAGAEGWNCITTDTTIFFSQTYSYKTLIQSCGRIDRLNTPFRNLYYFHLKSRSPIDLAISRAVKQKRKFNERIFAQEWEDKNAKKNKKEGS